MEKINKWLSTIIFVISVVNFVRLIYVCVIKGIGWVWGIAMVADIILGLWCLRDMLRKGAE